MSIQPYIEFVMNLNNIYVTHSNRNICNQDRVARHTKRN